jgi:predicted Zn-dependent protease
MKSLSVYVALLTLVWILIVPLGVQVEQALGAQTLQATPSLSPSSMAFVEHMRHHGQFLVWRQTTLRVYTSHPQYKTLIEQAFARWQGALQDTHPLNLHWVNTPHDAHLSIEFVDAIDLPIQANAPPHRRGFIAGLSTPHTYSEQGLQHVRMQCALFNRGGLPQKNDVLARVLLHEMGHALGLWGHSTNPYDVMHASFVHSIAPEADPQFALQNGDVRLIQGVYAHAKASKDSSGLNALPPAMQAVAWAKAEAQANPTGLSFWQYARALRQANEWPEATRQYQKALAYGGVNPALYLEFVQCLERQARNTEALAFLSERLPKGYETEGRLQLEKAYVLLKLKRVEEAKVVFKESLAQQASLAKSPVAQALSKLLGDDSMR